MVVSYSSLNLMGVTIPHGVSCEESGHYGDGEIASHLSNLLLIISSLHHECFSWQIVMRLDHLNLIDCYLTILLADHQLLNAMICERIYDFLQISALHAINAGIFSYG